jgi:hypothetical protein
VDPIPALNIALAVRADDLPDRTAPVNSCPGTRAPRASGSVEPNSVCG